MTPFLGCWSTSTSDECAAFNEIFFTNGDPTPAWAALYEDASCAGVQTAVADVGYFQGCCNEEAQTMIDCTVANADPRNTWNLTTPWEGLECPSIEIVPPNVPAPELCDAEPDFTCHVAGLPLCCSSDPSTCTTSDGDCSVW